MKILVVGSGSREHALCWKLAQSPAVHELFCTPGNPGTNEVARNLPFKVNDLDRIVDAVQELKIDFVVVGPEEPLSLGLADELQKIGVPTFGPSQSAARIETSKQWAKEIMSAAGVPTGTSIAVRNLTDGMAAVEQLGIPVAIKADGLAAGKGVVIANSTLEAEVALRAFLSERTLGAAGELCLVEEYLEGTELSVFALCDGKDTRLFGAACDYKRALDGEKGANTGGMGAYSPPPFATPELLDEVMRTIIEPTAAAMAAAGAPMRGVFFAGLMVTATGPKVVEFNCRFGDPETQVILPLLDGDLVDLLYRTATGDLGSVDVISARAGAAVGVVLASGGYPGPYDAGKPIDGLEERVHDTELFLAGAQRASDGQIVTAGGRVLTVVGTGK
ncbi:MAG: phosphoribosylamine--glycine ligase, partial [Thermomicrobiales bacterium]|nr:phosphoribosylamine--glycine ligase [Thermomicrobiales bacterium]